MWFSKNRSILLEKHTRKNAFCAYEVESVMGCGDYGGLQRWQLNIIHLSFGERKLYLQKGLRALHDCKALFVGRNNMDLIYECAAKFVGLERYEYKFVVSKRHKTREIILNFRDTDFFHLAGLHYFTDIHIFIDYYFIR